MVSPLLGISIAASMTPGYRTWVPSGAIWRGKIKAAISAAGRKSHRRLAPDADADLTWIKARGWFCRRLGSSRRNREDEPRRPGVGAVLNVHIILSLPRFPISRRFRSCPD